MSDVQTESFISEFRHYHPGADRWAQGFGRIQHSTETQARVFGLVHRLEAEGVHGDVDDVFELLQAADRLASAAMWLVVHETYARNVYLDGRDLTVADFKPKPDGHTGGALNVVPAYVGYLTANALTGVTRSWVMGQGHVVAAIDSVNLLVGNVMPQHDERYDVTDEGLTRYVRDFYSYKLDERGEQDSPLGSHVNPNTAGGSVEGGYLGFTELQYVHMPLPGESLVVFLSDGAFEEQRGSDWAPRWWRGEDSGLVMPIMIQNGRRIDQRTTMSMAGGTDWFEDHLRLNSFHPVAFDGRDPAAFAWSILEQERQLRDEYTKTQAGATYPVRLPYGIAVAPKGAGFYGEGTNLAHNLPLPGNPSLDADSRRHFNESARHLWVPPQELDAALARFRKHEISGRIPERDHPIANRKVEAARDIPTVSNSVSARRDDAASWSRSSPMAAVDEMFVRALDANPQLRARVGNPDEMRSNRLLKTLQRLKFRVTAPEDGMPESVLGGVVTALNEEAVASAALGNKGGINLIATYEAFGVKMFGVCRQEVIWADHANHLGRRPGWLSVPLILTSNTWENSKNEVSHQDPSMAEAMLGELSDVSRVLFPADFNSAAVTMRRCFETHGQLWTIVVPKQDATPDLLQPREAERLLDQGALQIDWLSDANPEVILTAIGAYQFEQVLLAAMRLRQRGVATRVVYMVEPGRFRRPRTEREAAHAAPPDAVETLYPASVAARVFACHTRPEPMLGTLAPLSTGFATTRCLGFSGRGGTLDVTGLLFINGCSWGHVVEEAAAVTGRDPATLLSAPEIEALHGQRQPAGVLW